jgi:hypothetical protein
LPLPNLAAQTVDEIKIETTTTPTPNTMVSHLNGVARNHVRGDLADDLGLPTWKEQRFNDKIEKFGSMQNNFSGGGKSLYRLGHNVSDGNYNYWDIDGFAVTSPGWHWATAYKTGDGNETWITTSTGAKYSIGDQSTPSSFSADLGAGIHRFWYVHQYAANDPAKRIFSGFTVTNNYDNSIQVTKCPASFSAKVDIGQQYAMPNLSGDVQVFNQTEVEINQVGGPPPGTMLSRGPYEVDYRITHKTNGDVSYCGFVVSVNDNNTSDMIIRTTLDIRNEIVLDPNVTDPMDRHNIKIDFEHFKLTSNANQLPTPPGQQPPWQLVPALNFDAEASHVYPTSQYPTVVTNACQYRPFNYDHLSYYLAELGRAQADACIVLNIATGYPEEAAGLAEYMQSKSSVAFYELGSELMGQDGAFGWNKGAHIFGRTPELLGSATLPFARAIKNFNSSIKVATTSTYNWGIDWGFINSVGTGTVKTKIEAWLQNLGNYVDYINIHNYPNGSVAGQVFNDAKVRELLAVNANLKEHVLPEIKLALGQLGKTNIKIVMTESNTAERGTNICVPANLARLQHLTMTEALYYAESFALAAKQGFKAFTPFALIKSQTLSPTLTNACIGVPNQYCNINAQFNIVNQNPLAPASYLADDPDFNLFFYPSVAATNACYGNAIYYRPTFMAKEIIAENLHKTILSSQWTGAKRQVQLTGAGFAQFMLDDMQTLATQSTNGDIHLMVINRRLPNASNPPIKISLDGAPITSASWIYMQGSGIDDKNPTSVPIFQTANLPVFQATTFTNGEITIPAFSITILKIAATIPPQPLPLCAAITSPQSNATEIPLLPTVTWNAAQYANNYTLLVGTAIGSTNVGTYTNLGNVTQFTLPTPLPLCTPVYFTLIPYNNSGSALNCQATRAITICPPACTVINTPQANATGIGLSPTIVWQPVQNATNYQVLVGFSPGAMNLGSFPAGNATSFPLPITLPACTQVWFTVIPSNQNGSAQNCTSISAITQCLPACTTITPLANPTAIAPTPTISWTAVANATSYTVLVGTTAGASNLGSYPNVNATSFTIPQNLPLCTPVWFTVIPQNAAGTATNCPSISATTICCPGCNNFPPITTNTTWSQPNGQLAWGTITVSNNATLTIPAASVIAFCQNGSLVIEPGSSVILDGTLTACDNSWLGIVVKDNFISGSNIIRGNFTSNAGARIEFANASINSRHGRVNCKGTTFRNNAEAIVSMRQFGLGQPVVASNNYGIINRFTGCTFTIDEQYRNTIQFHAHVRAVSTVNRMAFSNCIFNIAPTMPANRIPRFTFGFNIAASGVTVSGVNTRFERLGYGVQTTINRAISPNEPVPANYPNTQVEVRDATFDHCAVGIFDRSSLGNLYYSNTFLFGIIPNSYMDVLVIKNDPLFQLHFGAQLGIAGEAGFWGFTVRDNRFFGANSTFNTTNLPANVITQIGTNMVNLGANTDQVYRNIFDRMNNANLSLGRNGSTSGTTGLRYLCNTQTDMISNDILAIDHTFICPVASQLGTICSTPAQLNLNQGTTAGQPAGTFGPAFNTFSNPGFVFNFGNSNPLPLNYYFWDGPTAPPQHRPISILHVTPISRFVSALNCPTPKVIGGEGNNPPQGAAWTPGDTEENRQAYFEAKAALEASGDETFAYYKSQVNELAKLGVLSALYEARPTDSVELWLSRMETYDAAITSARLSALYGDFDAALGKLQVILSTYEEVNVDDLNLLAQIWVSLAQEQTSSVSAGAITLLEQAAEKEDAGYASAYARALLSQAGIVHYPPTLQFTNGTTERSSTARATSTTHALSAQPNPADQYVRFEIDAIETETKVCRIVVTDIHGKEVVNKQLARGQTGFVWNTQGQASGIYFARLIYGDWKRDEIKVLIQR